MSSLRYKLLLSYAILVFGILLVGAWAIYNFAVLGRSVGRIMADNYRSVLDAQAMKETLERQDSAMLFHLSGEAARARSQYVSNRGRFARAYADAASNITEKGETEAIRDIGREFGEYQNLTREFLGRPRTAADRPLYFARLEPAFVHLKDRCDDLLRLNQDAMVRSQDRAQGKARAATQTAVGLALGTLVLGILYSVNLSRRLVAPLVGLTEAARRIGQGDLEQRIVVKTRDEVQVLGDEFNRMTASLREYREREAARLHVAQRQAEAAINHLYEPVVVTDAQGCVVGLNRAGEALFGPEGERHGRPVEELEAKAISAAVREALERRAPVAPESERGIAVIPVDRTERVFRVRTAPLLLDGDGVAGAVTVLEDVTRLRELDRLKDEFISVASHELRTPLTSMQLAVQLLAEGSAGPLSDKQSQLVRMASQDATRLDRLTRDLLDLTRLEAGTAVPNRRTMPVAGPVEGALGPLLATAGARGVQIVREISPDLPPISGDLEQLSRVVSNLVANAVRHTPSGGTVRVTAAPVADMIEYTVSDTGEGIPPEYLDRVFERFAQVPGATAGGAGLGLPIARKIVEAHGGRISVESEPRKGTTFRFTVPVAPAQPASGASPHITLEKSHA
jgi:signal transduction histidine kinase